jgi:beta-N-acetylhexosaminidase
MTRLALAAVLALCLAAPACTGGPGDPEQPGALSVSVPDEAASIIGEVKQVEGSGGVRRFLVEQIATRSAGYPIARVFVSPQTRILVRSGGRTSRGTMADLAVGARVQAWFTGPVRESYPVQADAGTILVER